MASRPARRLGPGGLWGDGSRTPTREPDRSPAGGDRPHLVRRQLQRGAERGRRTAFGAAGVPAPRLSRPSDRRLSRRIRVLTQGAGGDHCGLPGRAAARRVGELRGHGRPLGAPGRLLRARPPAITGDSPSGPAPGAVGRGRVRCGAVGRSGGARHGAARQREPTFAAGLPGRSVRDRRRPRGGPGDRPTGSGWTSRTSSWSWGPSDPATCGQPCRRPWATRLSRSATGSEDTGAFVAADGRRVVLPDAGSDRRVTFVENDGEVVAALVHDETVLEDPQLRDAVTSATGWRPRTAACWVRSEPGWSTSKRREDGSSRRVTTNASGWSVASTTEQGCCCRRSPWSSGAAGVRRWDRRPPRRSLERRSRSGARWRS